MPEYICGNRSVSLRPADVIGKGGEADIYKKGAFAYKVFKQPKHPDLDRSPLLQQQARERIAEQQVKLPALIALAPKFPRALIAPSDILRDTSGMIVGYQMDLVADADVLFRYSERDFRSQGADDETVVRIFIDLHKTMHDVHTRTNLVIGDVNDLNVLVKGTDPFVIDVDSAQFGSFLARTFTTTFVDPLICDPKAHEPMMIRPHSPETDWYAYLVMLMRSLLFVGPFGGVYRPKDPKNIVPHDARPLRRISIFGPDIIYPKPARHFKILPDALLHHLVSAFEKDVRGVPPISLVENLRFTTCSACGTTHARGQCPVCVGVTPVMVKEVHTGQVKATKVFQTEGRILHACMQGGTLRYVYHHDSRYMREQNRAIVSGALVPDMRFRIRGPDTYIARGRNATVFGQPPAAPAHLVVDSYGTLPIIDANETSFFFADGGGLYRSNALGIEYREKIGDVLPHQTLFWTGDTLGFGFYRAAELSTFFVFRPAYRGLNDSVRVPPIRGQLVDSTCVFGRDRIWFFTVTREGGKTINRCFLIDAHGALLGSAESSPGEAHWLGNIRGATAAGDFLLVPTDDGVVRVVQNGTALGVAKEFPETSRFVDAGSHLFIGNDGLYVVRPHDIWRLVIG